MNDASRTPQSFQDLSRSSGAWRSFEFTKLPVSRLLFSCLLVAIAPSARAITIVDTGTPTSGSGVVTSRKEAMAAEFQLPSAARITEVQGFLNSVNAGNLTMAVYSDGGDAPNAELFSTSISLGAPTSTSTWQGASGLAWDLPGGTYWAVFRADATAAFGMPTSVAGVGGVHFGGAPNPLGNEARLFNGGFSGYYWSPEPGDALDFGVRIVGADPTTTVPDTGSNLMLGGIALVVLAGARRAQSMSAGR